MSRPLYLPEVRQFSQQQSNVVQRPEGLDGEGATGVQPRDVGLDQVERYSEVQASPGRADDFWAYPISPQASLGGDIVLVEKDLAFTGNTFLVDNWTNQWLFEPSMRRFVPPYSGGWVFSSPRGFQKVRVLLKAPSITYAPAAAIAGEFAWFMVHESYLPPAQGIIDRTKTPVVV